MNKYMNLAIEEAKIAAKEGNVPVGAVIVNNDKIISIKHNTKNTSNIAINHAEILCIIEACNKLNSWYLNDCDLYVTLKPCNMCMGAIAESRIKNVYYLLDSTYYENYNNKQHTNVYRIEDNSNYKELISNFFINLRD